MSTASRHHSLHPLIFAMGFYFHMFDLFSRDPFSQLLLERIVPPILALQRMLLLEWGITLGEAEQSRLWVSQIMEHQKELLPWQTRYQEAAFRWVQREPTRATLWMRHAVALMTFQRLLIHGLEFNGESPAPQQHLLYHWRRQLHLLDDSIYRSIQEQGIAQGLAAYLLRVQGAA